MKVKNANVSSKKTRQLIKDSFIELLYEKKDIKKVKVTELVKKANIDRTTFYSHYDNIYSVAQEFEDEFIDLIDFEIGKIKDYEELFSFFDRLKDIIKDNEAKYRMVGVSDFYFHFYNNANYKLKELVYSVVSNQNPKANSDELHFRVDVLIDGVFTQVIKYFTDKNYKYDLNFILNNIKNIV